MSSFWRRTREVLAVGAVATVLAAGCSNNSPTTQSSGNPQPPASSGNPFQLIADSAAKTTGAGSSQIAIELRSSGGTTGTFDITGSGAFDYANQVGRMSMTVPQVAGQGGGTMEMIIDHQTIYMKFSSSMMAGSAASGIFGSKPWIKMDFSGLSKLGSTTGSLSSSDPSQALDFLLGVSKDVKNLGMETIRGTQTTHYHVTLDLSKAAAQVPASIRSSYEQSVKQLGSSSTIPADVWVDGSGLVRKIAFSFSTPHDQDGGDPEWRADHRRDDRVLRLRSERQRHAAAGLPDDRPHETLRRVREGPREVWRLSRVGLRPARARGRGCGRSPLWYRWRHERRDRLARAR